MIPAREVRFRYTFGLGGLTLFLFLSLVVTGALELFYYEPSLERANASVQALTHLVPYGWLVRGLHYWAGQALVVTTGLHLVRVVLTGAYKQPRRFNWLLGVSLLVAVLLLNFTGLVLRWHNDIAWALTVGTNLLRAVPLVGETLYVLAVGGTEIGSATVVRFFGWHIFGLALPATVVVAWHLFRVRRDGGISHIQTSASPSGSEASSSISMERVPRRELVQREVLAALIASCLLMALVIFFPPRVSSPADFSNLPPDATAPWFFIWVQQLLRLGDAFLMGVMIPAGLLTLLALVPYLLDTRSEGVGCWFNREGPWAQIVILGMSGLVLGLILKGAFL
jgi:quinol-cytochrome oxidoreductase complex cytochrome b subunit